MKFSAFNDPTERAYILTSKFTQIILNDQTPMADYRYSFWKLSKFTH